MFLSPDCDSSVIRQFRRHCPSGLCEQTFLANDFLNKVEYRSCTVLYCTTLNCTLMYCTVLYCTILYCTLLYCIVLHCTVLYCTILYCTVLYCTALYCTMMQYLGSMPCPERVRVVRCAVCFERPVA